MILYHSTDDNGVAGIREKGFGVSHIKDSREQSWFAHTREECMKLAHGKEWLVKVELPDDIANQYLYELPDGTTYEGNFLIPWAVVNQYRPFRYEWVDTGE